ncbi:MAG: glycosyltransferase family 39 protein [Candidatus Sumerlaeota bacterium]|nr:glycosyltransferase family 39 protein [Candidatus Sumerlaeota bacterium]
MDWLIAGAIGLFFACGVAITWGSYGHSWDEAYYYEPARLVQHWTRTLVFEPSKALSRGTINQCWGGNEVKGCEIFINELPALPKFAWAGGLTLFRPWLMSPGNAMRTPVAVAFALLLMLAYRFAYAVNLGFRFSVFGLKDKLRESAGTQSATASESSSAQSPSPFAIEVPSSKSQFLIPHSQSPIASHESQISNLKSQITNHESPTPNHEPQTANPQSSIVNRQSSISGRSAAVAAALLLAMMPRVWGEAHLAVAETLAALMSLLTVYCFWRGLFSWRWAVMAGVAFGLALNTKVQAVLLPVALLIWAQIYARPRHANAMFSLIFIGPAVWVLTCPWLWPDPAARMFSFFQFYARHAMTGVYYLGQTWNVAGAPACPWHYPWIITAVVVPPLTLLAFLLGAAQTMRRARSHPVSMLLLISALFPIAFISLPSQAKFDGARLFGAAFPAMAVLTGVTLARMIQRWREGWTGWAARSLYVLALLGGAFAIFDSHPYGLSYFNAFIGGTRGAEAAGMEVAYWGEAINDDVIRTLNELPPNAQLMTRAIHDRALEHLQAWGKLRQDIKLGSHEGDHFLLVQNRRGFWTPSDYQIEKRFKPLKPWGFPGVPLVLLYRIVGVNDK